MPINSNESVIFNIDGISDNQILVYDAATGSFKNETAAVSANASVTGLGRNVGTYGVGLYKQNDSQYLEFYKLQAGANATIALNDNVITIDAVVGSGSLTIGSANANTVLVADANGNIANGSDSILFDGTTFSLLGSSQNVTVADGTVTSNNLVTTNLTFAGMTLPTADGNAGQVLVTDGANNISFTNRTDISGKVDSTTFNAHVATAITTNANHAPALNNLYSLGNGDNKYAQVFSTYFRGTADLAVNSQNLNSIPAANYRLVADSFTKAEVNALIANVDTANTSGLLSNVTVTNGTTSFVEDNGTIDIRAGDNISVTPDTTNKRITVALDANVVTKTFRQINANGTNIVAETDIDTVEFVAGTGMTITGDANTDTITFASTGGGGGGSAQDLTLSGNVISLSGQSGNVDLTSLLASGGGNSNVALTDFSVSSGTPSGNGSLSYNNAGVFTFTPANVQATTQSLSWNAGTSELSISSGNTVDLSVLAAQTLTLSGNVISLTGQSGNADLTNALANVAGNYGDSNVASYLTTNNYATDSDIATANTNMQTYVNTANTNMQTYVDTANTNMQTYVNTANTNVVAYVDNQVTLLKGGANVNLDSLAEVANALNNSNSQLSTVAFTGTYSDLQTRPTISLSGSDLTYDGTTLDLSGLGATGPQGPQGNAGTNGTDGLSVSSGTITGNSLVLTMSDSSTINVTGNVVGPTGATGAAGSNGTDGTDGVGITSISLVGGSNLVLNYSNSSTQDVGNIKGPTGSQGPAGNVLVTTSNAAPSGASEGQMWYATDNGHTYIYHNSAWVQANPGQDPQTISLSGNVLTISGSNSNVDFTSALNINTDAQDLTLSGNVISLSGQSGNVDLTSLLGSAGGGISNVVEDTSPQLGGSLDVNGQDIVTTSNGDIDLDPNGSGVVVFKGNATKGSGQFKLNCENNSHGITIKGPPHSAGANYTLVLPNDDGNADQVLKTDGSGTLSWVDQSGGASTLNALTDVSAGSPSSGQVLKWNGSAWAPAADNTGGGGGGSSSFEYFKLYYTSAGAIDTAQGTGGISDKSTNLGNVTVNNAASNSCEIIVDFGGNYNYPPIGITAYGYSQSTSEYNIKSQIQSAINTTLKLDGSGSPHGSLGTSNVTMSLTRSETGSSSGFGQTSHAWIYFIMGG